MITLRTVINELKVLRILQKEYSSMKNPDIGRIMRRQETSIDSLITDYDKEEKSRQQPELFKGAS